MRLPEQRKMNIVFESGIDRIVAGNASFDKGVLRVCYTGANRNNTFLSRATIERCIHTIYNCPVVCNYDRDTDSIGAHDQTFVSDANGNTKLVNLTQPVGIVPESAKYWWEEITDASGVHEYLCTDVLLWKRQEAYAKIKENKVTDESMEISVYSGQMIDGVYHIDDFEFTAFCLLESAPPCFESASLTTYALDEFKAQMTAMMNEVRQFSLAQSPDGVGIQNQLLEGGESKLDPKKEELIKEYGIDVTTLDFSIEDMTVDELRAKFEAMKNAPQATPAPADPAPAEPAPQGNFVLESQVANELGNAVGAEQMIDKYGDSYSRYWMWDYDKDVSEVYVVDRMDYNYYGFSYTMSGDKAVVDFATKKRMKIALEPYVDGTQGAAAASAFSLVVDKYQQDNAKLKKDFTDASAKISGLEKELEELRKFKADTDAAAAQSEREQVLAQFEDLAGNEAFESLKSDCAKFSKEDLEEKCFAIRGRLGASIKFSANGTAPKLPIEPSVAQDSGEPYGGIFAEYGFTPEN